MKETTFEAGPGKHVLLQFTNIDIEEGRQYEGCIYDWVEVRSNNTAINDKNGDKYCGTTVPAEPILSKGSEMSVLFHSDRVNEGTGFSATLFEGISGRQALLDIKSSFYLLQCRRWKKIRLLTITRTGVQGSGSPLTC